MSHKPLVISSGQIQQLPSGEALNVGWDLPVTGPAANSVLICTSGGVITWPAIGASKYFSTDASGNVVFADKPWGLTTAAPTADNQVLQATGSGTAAWTTDVQTLTSLVVDNITLDGNVLTSSTGTLRSASDILLYDNVSLVLGTGSDAKISYNGTDLVVDPDVVGSGFLKIDGRMKTVYGNNVRFSHIFANTLGTPTTGTMKIRLATSWQGRQFTYIISGVDNVTGAWYLRFGGTPSNSGGGGWTGQSCSLFGKPPFKQVRVAHDGTGACILLGNESTSWSYQLVLIDMETDSGFTAPAITMTMTFSSNEAVDWTLASVEDCPIYLTAGVEIEDDGAGGVNLLVNGISVAENIEVGGSDVCRVLADNRTYYVRTTGNDTTGDGSAGTPFATVGRALDEIYKWVADENIITIDVGEGTFNETTLSPTYAYGSNLYVTGVAETHTSGCAVSSIGSVTALEAGLEYIDFIITLPVGYTTSTGQYIACKAASGGTNNHLVLGVHEVIGWNSGTRAATVRCVRRAGVTAVPSGAISLTDIRVIKTVLAFASGHGISMTGAYHGGNWDRIVLAGNSSGYALNLLSGASFSAGESFGTSNWNHSIYCAGNGNFFGDKTFHSFCRGSLLRVQNGGVAQIRYGTVLTGAKTNGIFCFVGATVAAYQVQMATCGNADGIMCYQGGFVDVSSGYVRDGNPTGNGCNANRGGGIDASSATISGYANSTTTATNGYIIGP